MKSVSIKKKMMLWYAFVLLVIVALATLTLLITGNKLVRDGAKANITTATDRAVKYVRVINGKLNIEDNIEYYSNGTHIVIYKDDGTQLSGLEMDDFNTKTAFKADTVREIEQDEGTFYVYDRLIENKKVGKIWVRGMAYADLEVISPAISRLVKIFLLALPLLLIMALLGGWLITKRAFAPLKEINDTAKKIYEGNDLSLRIGLSDDPANEKGDEIMQTAAVFDNMLDGIEKHFESEKRFTNDASHELRTPTSVIMTQSEDALKHTDDPKETGEALRTILGQSQKMSELLDKLLMLARADRGVIEMGSELIDLGLLTETSAAYYAQAAEKKNITIDVNVRDSIMMTGDTAFMERAIENLISNAVKYGREGGRVTIDVSLSEAGSDPLGNNDEEKTGKGQLAKILISDDGIGIPQEHLSHIWDRFYRVSGAGDHESMGLGLSLTQWIITEHGGRITVESEEGKGSTFTILLPLDRRQ